MTRFLRWAGAIALAATVGCGDDDDSTPASTAPSREAVIAQYATVVHASYQESHDKAVTLKEAIDAFVADPSAPLLDQCKRAWLEARIPYGQTEAYRFYAGPIDDEDGPEGLLNAWPLDEIYIDYVEGADDAGIVNATDIDITKDRLVSLSEGGEGDVLGTGGDFDAEKAISIGYHAIEFLLWGQDVTTGGPGSRPFEDYLTGAMATAPNGDRRGDYLQITAEILVEHLAALTAEWEPGAPYRTSFEAGGDESLRKMLTGIGVLSKGELAGERMDVALDSLDQEDEHSCFSDNTHNDVRMNALGIQNVYLGRYYYLSGPSVHDLLEAADPALAARMKTTLETALAATDAIPPPFDEAIGSQGSPGWNAVNEAVNDLFDVGDTTVEVAAALGLGAISVELPE
jgi:putative iron-regulated protein